MPLILASSGADWPTVLRALLAALTAFAASFALTPLVRLAAVRAGLISRPVEDRWGRRVVARLGGSAMFGSFVAATLIWLPLQQPIIGMLLALGLVFALGLADDLHRMPPYTKLAFQLLIGCVAVLFGVHIELGFWRWLSIPLSVLWFVLVMNAFNLLDNMDGLAAGVGAIAAAVCAAQNLLLGHWMLVTLDVIFCGSCLGFLAFNFPPAKIYMGDSGSHFIGLGLAMLAPLGHDRSSTHLLSILAVPVFVLAVPIFDTCFVAIQRLAHRRNPFVGGTDHVSHRLAVLGLTERQTVLALYGISAILGLLGIVSADLHVLPALAIWGTVLTALVLLGCYLAQVNVYRLQETPAGAAMPEPSDVPVTLIDTMLLHKRRLLEILVDFCVISSAYVFAHLLRFEGSLSVHLQELVIQSLPLILVMKLGCFVGCGLYRRMWRYPDLSDILAIFKAVTLGSMLSALTLLYAWRFNGYSRSVLVIDWMLSFLAVAGTRVAERLLDEWIGSATEPQGSVLIVGAGETGERVLRSLRFGGRCARRVVGFIDDDPRKVGNQVHGFRILGTRAQLPDLLDRHGVREVLVAIGDPPGELLHHIRHCCESRGTVWRVVTAAVTDGV